MKAKNLETINRSFEQQAENFESKKLAFTKQGYLDYTTRTVAPSKTDNLLEVAAGTCACGRTFAPLVHSVTCLDATEAMLLVGRDAAKRNQLENMAFIKGCIEELPFLDDSFDIVFSRLAFHHFADIDVAFSEMVRVLKPNGKLVMIDMEAAEETLREVEDEIETLRDPSHVRNLSKDEMLSLFAAKGLNVTECDTKNITQQLTTWLALTNTPQNVQDKITMRMQLDIEGNEQTGFYPYLLGGEICFDQRWVITIGTK